MPHLTLRNTVLSDRRLPLPGRVVVLGRSLDVDLPLPHRSVSRRHALIEFGMSGHMISDLGSSNGTFVGDRRLQSGERVPLPLGAEFRLGEVRILLSPDEVIDDDGAAPGAIGAGGSTAGSAVAPALPAAPAPPKRIPAPVPTRSSASESPTPARGRTTPRPSPARRAARWRERKRAMRWLGVLVTVILLVVAGIFLSAILRNSERGAATEGERDAAPERVEKRHRGLERLRVPGESEEPGDR